MYLIEIILGLFGFIIGIVSFYIRRLYDKMDEIELEFNAHRLDNAKTCMTRYEMEHFSRSVKDDISKLMDPLHEKLRDIETYLRKEHN